jgi:hypothetical protein
VACLTNGTDETLSLGVNAITSWAIEESTALSATPDLSGMTIDRIKVVADEMTVTGTEGDYTLTMDLRWEFYEP